MAEYIPRTASGLILKYEKAFEGFESYWTLLINKHKSLFDDLSGLFNAFKEEKVDICIRRCNTIQWAFMFFTDDNDVEKTLARFEMEGAYFDWMAHIMRQASNVMDETRRIKKRDFANRKKDITAGLEHMLKDLIEAEFPGINKVEEEVSPQGI